LHLIWSQQPVLDHLIMESLASGRDWQISVSQRQALLEEPRHQPR
jgi:hypothetical protein